MWRSRDPQARNKVPWWRGSAKKHPNSCGGPTIRPRSTLALADLAWLSWGQRGARPISRRWPRLHFNATSPVRRLRLRTVVTIAFASCAARPARASPRQKPAVHPWSTRALVDLTWLSARPTRGALHPTPLAEAPLRRHRARSAAAASKHLGHSFRVLCRAARARFAPWRTGHPPTEHARAGGLGVVVYAANAGRAPAHDVRRGSSSPTPPQVGGCGFGTLQSKLPNSVARGPCALRPVKNQPTAHRARARWRTWRG